MQLVHIPKVAYHYYQKGYNHYFNMQIFKHRKLRPPLITPSSLKATIESHCITTVGPPNWIVIRSALKSNSFWCNPLLLPARHYPGTLTCMNSTIAAGIQFRLIIQHSFQTVVLISQVHPAFIDRFQVYKKERPTSVAPKPDSLF
jgi:hypothetical protein